jgi:hypothetical protein
MLYKKSIPFIKIIALNYPLPKNHKLPHSLNGGIIVKNKN